MAKVAKPVAPDHLTMALFTPGMTALHRAGLGGLGLHVEGAGAAARKRLASI